MKHAQLALELLAAIARLMRDMDAAKKWCQRRNRHI